MPNPKSDLSVEIGHTLGAFSATPRNGLILLIGDVASRYQHEVLSGMSLSTRLIVNLAPDSKSTQPSGIAETDLRVAVHRQSPEAFLDDVHQHRFNLVVTDTDISDQLIGQIASMLLEGGFWVIVDESESGKVVSFSDQDFHREIAIGCCQLLVKRVIKPSAQRRGGRRGRQRGSG